MASSISKQKQFKQFTRYFSTSSQILLQDQIQKAKQTSAEVAEKSQSWINNYPQTPFKDQPPTFMEYFGLSAEGRKRNYPSQKIEFPNVPQIQPAAIIENPETKITTLNNGFKVATEQLYGSAASIQLSVNAGSAYEILANRGITQLMQYLGFKSTYHRTHLRLQLELEGAGAIYSTRGEKEMINYKVDFPMTHLPTVTEVLLDCVLNPKLQYWEVRDFAKKMIHENHDIAHHSPEHQMLDLIYQTAYEGGLANPTSVFSADNLTFQTAREFYNLFYAPNNMVLSCVGAFDHNEVINYVEPLTRDLTQRETPKQFPSKYSGGEHRERTKALDTNICILFEVADGWANLKQAAVMAVIGKLLGGGGDFSAGNGNEFKSPQIRPVPRSDCSNSILLGGPGKGMQSRLYLNILTQKGHYKNVNCVTQLHKNTGFIGLHGVVLGNAREAGKEMVKELVDITKSFPEEQLIRSKNQLIRQMYTDIESATALSDEIASNVAIYGRRIPVDEYVKYVNEVTVNDITSFMQKALKTKPTLVVLGNIDNPPRESDILSMIK